MPFPSAHLARCGLLGPVGANGADHCPRGTSVSVESRFATLVNTFQPVQLPRHIRDLRGELLSRGTDLVTGSPILRGWRSVE